MKYLIILICLLIPIMAMGQGTLQDTLWTNTIATDSLKDAWYGAGTAWDLSGTELDFGHHTYDRISGFIIGPLAIDQGSPIDTAYLGGKAADDLALDSSHVTIWAEAVDSAPLFADDSSAFKTRFANVGSDSTVWRGIEHYVGNTWYVTPNFANIITEVVGRAGWKSGNSICIFFKVPGDATDDAARKWRPCEFDGYNGSPYYRIVWSAVPESGTARRRRILGGQ